MSETIKFALEEIKDKDRPLKQIELSNKIINLLVEELKSTEFSENLIESEGKILQAVFSKLDFPYSNLKARLKEITPYTRLSQSELFTMLEFPWRVKLKKKFFLPMKYAGWFLLLNFLELEYLKRNWKNLPEAVKN